MEDIGCINAHGTGTEANDRAESKGIAKFCGNAQIPVRQQSRSLATAWAPPASSKQPATCCR